MWQIRPMGEAALLIECDEPDMGLANRLVLSLSKAIDRTKLSGVMPAVPAIASLIVRFDPLVQSPVLIEAAVDRLARYLEPAPEIPDRIVEIPTRFGGEWGEDLPKVADTLGLAQADIIETLCERPYRVMCIGFAVGHPYIGPLPPALHLPRRSTPRSSVPKGRVAMAAGLANVYPAQLPGGWHLVGHTELSLFDPNRAHRPSLLVAGDGVRFVPISTT